MSNPQNQAPIEAQKELIEKAGISSEKLNLVIAICAILISAASFYATYLQADAAERQVKAMTMPLIQFTHGNWDEKKQSHALNFRLKNAGIGPAIIKSIEFKYEEKSYINWRSFYIDCCLNKGAVKKNTVNAITNPVVNSILAGQSELLINSIEKNKNDDAFWQKLNVERKKLTLKVCYCSMLDKCYITEKNGVVAPINHCPTKQ